ncbi:MAG TPA: tRNA(Ile)(2)-agmatinylcytidine synthase [Thermoplasmataceae archaeon]|nr:tRNA(Ile)(2)-agmatinylcytidine synthase [Thermoplasmataceae archaeon]
MLLAVDDTDSQKGMCTTFLLTEIVKRISLRLADLPRLVRLDPAIPYKTRGNGALAAELVAGHRRSWRVGRIDDSDIYTFQGEEPEEPEMDNVLEEAASVIYDLAELSEENTNPGLVLSRVSPPEDFYWRAVREEVTIDEAVRVLDHIGARYVGVKNSRGLIGATAAMSWKANRQTYELIFYRNHPEPIPHELKLKVARQMDDIPGTFNNVDTANRHAAIFPREKTPVLAGVRSLNPSQLIERATDVMRKNGIAYDRFMLFRTNQATDDHIIRDPHILEEGKSYSVEAAITANPEGRRGSHYFTMARWKDQNIILAAFEPTKEFRKTFREMRPGDLGRFYGTFTNNCLSLEKMEIISTSAIYTRRPPKCQSCGTSMINEGYHSYFCRNCGEYSDLPEYHPIGRGIVPGLYDVPVTARRHLSRPFSLGNPAGEEKLQIGFGKIREAALP